MRISVVVPDDLGAELERYKRQEHETTSAVVRQALVHYLREHRRRLAGERLKRAAAADPLSPEKARRLLKELSAERRASDRF